AENAWTSSSLVVWNEMLPTYSFLLMLFLRRALTAPKRTTESNRERTTVRALPAAVTPSRHGDDNAAARTEPLRQDCLDNLGAVREVSEQGSQDGSMRESCTSVRHLLSGQDTYPPVEESYAPGGKNKAQFRRIRRFRGASRESHSGRFGFRLSCSAVVAR